MTAAFPSTVKLGDIEYTLPELALAAKMGLLNIGQKNDPASTTPTAQTLHGPFPGNANQLGLFSGAGVRPERFSALQRPETFLSILPIRTSEFTNEILEIMTGQLAGGTTNASDFCGNPPVVGDLKVMRRVFTWGDYYVKTNLNPVILTGQRVNRADVPASILNTGPAGNPLIPDIMYDMSQTRSQMRTELFKIGVDLERNMEIVAIRGTADADNSRTGFFNEFAGLDGQIATGLSDSVTGLAAPAADSAVVTFNADVEGTAADGRNLVETLNDTWYGLKDRAARVGMGGVVWAIVMRKEAFRRVTDTLACELVLHNCAGSAASPNNRDGMAIQALRMEMLNGNFLRIEADNVPVVFSEGILHEVLANNTYMSDMYFVPLSWNGMPLTTIEYFPADNPWATEFANFVGADNIRTINNGMYLVGRRDTGLCIEYHFQARFRLILELPYLAARIDNLQYTYLAPTREAIPGASFYVDGGATNRE